MKTSEYWQKRFELLEQAAHQQGTQCYADIEKQYRQAQKTIEGQIASWYQRFADNNGVTLADAKMMLNAKELAELKWDIRDYIRYGKENARNQQWVKQLENASARFHVSRLEALKLQTQQSIELMFGNQLDSIDSTMRNVYKSGYYHTAYEIQKGVGVGRDFFTLDDKQIGKVINKPWAADGKNFSERIWGNRQKLVNELNQTLTQNIILGKDPQKAIDQIARKMNISKVNAGRLVMTEEAFFNSAAQKDCFAELDVEMYEIVATLDSHTSDICRGMDGKHFKMSEWQIGTTAPPFHVHCRTTTVPFFDDEFNSVGERAARDEEKGKIYYVPGDMTYKEWESSFVDGDKTDLQEIENDVENTFDNAIIELTEEDRYVLNQYISFDFYQINEKLRNGSSLTEKEHSMVKQLDTTLKKLPRYTGTVSRSIYFGNVDLVKEYLKQFQVDGEVCFKQFMSTTCGTELYNPDAEIQIYIENSIKGRNLIAINEMEMEVLYEREQNFLVRNIVLQNGQYWILLEEN